MIPDEMEVIARKRAETNIGFYIHALVFCLVMLGSFAVNYLTSLETWRTEPFLTWGVALAIHGMVIFTKGSGLKERLVQAEKLRRNA